MGDWRESEEFYNAMQSYRCAPMSDQREVMAYFENVKRLIRANFKSTEDAKAFHEQ